MENVHEMKGRASIRVALTSGPLAPRLLNGTHEGRQSIDLIPSTDGRHLPEVFSDNPSQHTLDFISVRQYRCAGSCFLLKKAGASSSVLFLGLATGPVGGRGLCRWAEGARGRTVRIRETCWRWRIISRQRGGPHVWDDVVLGYITVEDGDGHFGEFDLR
jgi:hypothetical protein